MGRHISDQSVLYAFGIGERLVDHLECDHNLLNHLQLLLPLPEYLMRERLEKLEDHPHIPLLNLIDLISNKADELLLEGNPNPSNLLHLLKPITDNLLQLLNRIRIEDDIDNLA